MSLGNSRFISAFSLFASVRMERIRGGTFTGNPPPISRMRIFLPGPVLHFLDDACCDLERLHVVLEVRALAADMETQALDDEPVVERLDDQVHCFPGWAPNLLENSTMEPVFGRPEAQDEPGMGSMVADLQDLIVVVECNEGLYLSSASGSRSA